MHHSAFYLLLISVCISIVSCTSETTDTPIDTGGLTTDTDDTDVTKISDTGSDADAKDDVDHYDADVDNDVWDTDYKNDVAYPPCDDGQFFKPISGQAPEISTVANFPSHDDETPRTTYRGPTPRDHMRSDGPSLESWLYPGEFFVADHSVVQHNVWWLPSEYTVVVLLDGEPIPFAIETIPDPEVTGDDEATYPTMSEIEEWPDEDYDDVHTMYVEDSIPLHYTIVVPPWAFPDIGGYNIQILRFPVWEDVPESWLYLAANIGIGAHTYTQMNFLHTHTVYYGEHCLDDHSDAYVDRTDEAKEWDSTDPGLFVGRVNFQFLAPPLEVCDWAAIDWPDEESCLSEVLTFPEQDVVLNFYTAGLEPMIGMRTDTRGLNLYYVLRDHEVVDTFLFEPEEADWHDVLTGEEKGVSLPIELTLTEELAAYQIIGVPNPFSPQLYEEELFSGRNPVESNALLLQYDSDLD